MKDICPTCGEKKEIIETKEDGNTTKKIFSCGHKLIHVKLQGQVKFSKSLGLKGESSEKDDRGKPIEEFKEKVSDDIAKRFNIDRSDEETKVLQIVKNTDDERILHIHAKRVGIEVTAEEDLEKETILNNQQKLMDKLIEFFESHGYKVS